MDHQQEGGDDQRSYLNEEERKTGTGDGSFRQRSTSGRGNEPPGRHIGDLDAVDHPAPRQGLSEGASLSLPSTARGQPCMSVDRPNPNLNALRSFNPRAETNLLMSLGGRDPRAWRAPMFHTGQQPGFAAAQMQGLPFNAAGLGGSMYHGMMNFSPFAPNTSLLPPHFAATEAVRQRNPSVAAGSAQTAANADMLLGSRDERSLSRAFNDQQLALASLAGSNRVGLPDPIQNKASTAAEGREEVNEEAEEFPSFDIPKEPQLPPIDEGDVPHYTERSFIPLAIQEDSNWLSERQCFIRAELLEVVRANKQEVDYRSSSKSIKHQQVGIRCRFCAHLEASSRTTRSAAYPSSIRQMYQSFIMITKFHFADCSAMPDDKKRRFIAYQNRKIPSSALSREYWTYAAQKLGMVNTNNGISLTPQSQAAALKMLPFRSDEEHVQAMDSTPNGALIDESEKARLTPFLFSLMSLLQKCYLKESELVGKRKDASSGIAGVGCRLCCQRGRLGFCRVFPLNKRSLPTKINDIYCHMMRCPLTPRSTKILLRNQKQEAGYRGATYQFSDQDRGFLDRLWAFLRHDMKKET